MYRKCKSILLLVSVLMFAVGLIGCGSKETANVAEIEERSVAEEVVEVVEEGETLVEESVEEEITEEVVEEIVVPKWYLDEDGLKNEELNLLVSKSAEGVSDHQLKVTLAVDGMDLPFYCSYSDGNLDEYISQREEMQKGQIGNIEFAYDEENIIFIGDGLEIRSSYAWRGLEEGTNVVDWLEEKNIVKTLEEPLKECMAYSTKDGLYCPAMGIAICKKGAVDGTSAIGVAYSYEQEDGYSSVTISNKVDRSVIGNASNTQEAIDNLKSYFGDDGLTWIDSNIEVNLGNKKLIGSGFDRGDTFIFFMYSENLEYDIDVWASNEQVCVNGFAVVESLN